MEFRKNTDFIGPRLAYFPCSYFMTAAWQSNSSCNSSLIATTADSCNQRIRMQLYLSVACCHGKESVIHQSSLPAPLTSALLTVPDTANAPLSLYTRRLNSLRANRPMDFITVLSSSSDGGATLRLRTWGLPWLQIEVDGERRVSGGRLPRCRALSSTDICCHFLPKRGGVGGGGGRLRAEL